MNKQTHNTYNLANVSKSNNINNPELLNYIKKIGKEMAMSLKDRKNNPINPNTDEFLEEFTKNSTTSRYNKITYQSSTPDPPKKAEFSTLNYNDSSSDLSEEPLDSLCSEKKDLINNKESSSFYERKNKEKTNKNLNIRTLKAKKMNQEDKKFISRPQINKNTQKIIQKNMYKPIHKRLDEIIESKNLKRENLKKAYQESKHLQDELECSSRQVIKCHFNPQHFENWRQKQLKLEENRINRIHLISQEKERLETEEAKTRGTPTINEYSRIICNSVSDNTGTPVYEKLYHDKDIRMEKRLEKVFESIPTFTPTISRNIPKFDKKKFIYVPMKTNTKHSVKEIRSVTPNTIIYKDMYNKDTSSSKKKYVKLNDSMNSIKNYTIEKADLHVTNFKTYDYKMEVEPTYMSKFKEALEKNENIKNKSINIEKYIESNNINEMQNIVLNEKTIQGKIFSPFDDNYKINVRNVSSCMMDKENVIVYKSKHIKKGIK